MNETPDGRPTAVDVERLAECFEKTILEIHILDSLYGRSSSVSDYVKNVFQASVEDLRDSGTLRTVAGIVADGNEWKREEYGRKDGRVSRRTCSDDEQQYATLEKNLQTLRRKDEEIDSILEKCIVDGERLAIRRETEKNYVDKWEKARVENFKFKFQAEELELQKRITELQAKLETEKLVDAENEKFLSYCINELEKQIEYWECKYKTDTTNIEEKLKNRMITLEEKTKKVQSLKKTYMERQNIIEEHARNKQKLQEEKQLNDRKEKMATKIQAWWRGTMVRRHLGPYKHLLGSRKKSIKKQQISKGKKTKRNS